MLPILVWKQSRSDSSGSVSVSFLSLWYLFFCCHTLTAKALTHICKRQALRNAWNVCQSLKQPRVDINMDWGIREHSRVEIWQREWRAANHQIFIRKLRSNQWDVGGGRLDFHFDLFVLKQSPCFPSFGARNFRSACLPSCHITPSVQFVYYTHIKPRWRTRLYT